MARWPARRDQAPIREAVAADASFVDAYIVNRFVDGMIDLIDEIAQSPGHPMRKSFDAYLGRLEVRLRDDPEMEAQAERLKAAILHGSELDAVVAAAWSAFKGRLDRQPERDGEPTSARLAEIVARVAAGMLDEPQIVERFNERICDAADSVLVRFQQQFSLLITEIVQRWDAAEITEKIEIELGPDLQFIRLNGSLVGGAAGVVLHAALVVTGAAV